MTNLHLSPLQTLLTQVETLAQQAGAAIMHIYANEFSVEEKADNSPLTEADKAAHTVIMRGLNALEEKIPVLSEEDVEHFSGMDVQQRYWLVDPLDGTKEFIKRNGEFTVNIALIQQGKPILGVVYAPATGVTYSAAQGLGAFKNIAGENRQRIQVAGQPAGAWRVVGSRSHSSPDLAAWLQQLGEHVMLPMGSSLKLCLVAEGQADVYPRLGPTCLWDTGAAHAIVCEAGGRVETLSGEALHYGQPQETLNPHFIVWGSSVSH